MTPPPSPTDLLRGVNLYLIGMMGAGKTTLGQWLAQQLSYRFVDTDALVEQIAGKSIPDIFATDGEATFRDWESAILQEVAPYPRLVVATGGGIIGRSQNWGHLQTGVVVWLDVPLGELTQRLATDRSRPLLQRPDWPDHLATLLQERRPQYAAADIHLAIAPGESVAMLGERLLTHLGERLIPPGA